MNQRQIFPPSLTFSARARVRNLEEYRALYEAASDDPETFWRGQASCLDWYRQPDRIYEEAEAGEATWFAGGRLNVTVNCVDRHAASQPDNAAIIWARNEPGEYETITFAQLKSGVGRFANLLLELGVRKGDRVCLYMPMMPELVVAMLACARIGAVHSVIFAGFSAEALRGRILDAGARVLVTADQGLRGNKVVPLKRIADEAVSGLDLVEHVLVARRTGADVPTTPRDIWLDEALTRHRTACTAAWMASEDPLFLLYTSGSTGKPKGLVHTTAGYLVWTSFTHRYVFDARADDINFCAADIGWITGHSYVVYGPLANGVPTVLFEGVPTWPDAGRMWKVVEDLRATLLYTSPTALRSLMRESDDYVTRYDRGSLRVLGSAGEPINPEVWRWFYEVVGESRCPIVDTWWQTETGGTMITPLPGATPLKPGSASLPMVGVRPVLLDADGNELTEAEAEGLLCLKGSWPGQARTIFGDHQRYRNTYFSAFPGYYFTGDGCRRDADGYYWITGRVDDVINISGHRLGTAEVESALVAHDDVAEAAVLGMPHPIKGQGIAAFVLLVSGVEPSEQLVGALKEQVRHVIGPVATPDAIHIVPDLPKTRSGKVMRRVLGKLVAGRTELGDLSTLADPTAVDGIRAALEGGA
jgi:acetyl-CoA synthetase